jgi:hypothetical protein
LSGDPGVGEIGDERRKKTSGRKSNRKSQTIT